MDLLSATSTSTTLLLLLLFMSVTKAQHAAVPCPFNAMCSCKMTRSSDYDAQDAQDAQDAAQDAQDDAARAHPKQIVSDVSCVGVPFAALPPLPAGKITHVDIVSSGLQVADVGGSFFWPTTLRSRSKIESLRLMSNKIRTVGDHVFASMSEDLKSLDLSYNQLDEVPVRALKKLKVLDWANFHSNGIASLEGLGALWVHLSPTLHALFLGNNDITALPRATPTTTAGGWGESDQHDSLSQLQQLNWLNVDGNQLTDIDALSLPPKLHTLSAAHNRISRFPVTALTHLEGLRWLDLRGNHIQEVPTAAWIGNQFGNQLQLDKLDLGENLISRLGDVAMFNQSLQIRDLYLDFNRLERIPEAALAGTDATRLYLSSNALKTIDDRAFHSLSTSLILLDLDRNHLGRYPPALNHLKRLRFLYLANNDVATLADSDLASFGAHLEALSLAGNHFHQFPNAALVNCPKLAHLNMAYNTIENITADMFHEWAANLEVLILKGNQVSRLPSRLFRHAPKLRELSLSFNQLKSLADDALSDVAATLETLELNMVLEKPQFPHALLKPLRHLHWLSLEHNRINVVPTTAIDHLNQLRYLSLEGNRLTSISSSLFKSGRLRQLRDIRLSYNLIETFFSRTFHNLHEVTTIVAAHNRIKVVHHSAFDHLPKLITLNLAHNLVERLEPHAFRWLPNLLKIELQSNRLKTFSWDAVANCTNPFMAATLNLSGNHLVSLLAGDVRTRSSVHFKLVDLSHNHLSSFPPPEFLSVIESHSLKKLILRHNRIVTLPPAILSVRCPHLQVLDLHHNHIELVDRTSLSGGQHIQQIDLSYNRIEALPEQWLARLLTLRMVDLSANRLRALPRNLFEGTSIDTLNLARNHLSTFPVGCLTTISSTLAHLDLSHNQIEHLDAVVVSSVPNLVSLKLSHNRLSLLPDNVFSHLNSLVQLDLSFNTIRANFKELFHYLQRIKELQLANIGLSTWPHMPLAHLIVLNVSANSLDNSGGDPAVHHSIRLDRLRVLDLSRNRFSHVPSFLWTSTPFLKELDLSANPIRRLDSDSFAGLWRLKTLAMQPLPVLETTSSDALHSLVHLKHLKIQTWPGPSVAELLNGLHDVNRLSVEVRSPVLGSQLDGVANLAAAPKLKQIDIFGAQLKSLQLDVFAHLGTRTLPECTVAIQHTSIKHIPEGLLQGLEGCASLTLDLRMNALQTLSPQSIRNNNSLSTTSTRHLTGGLLLEGNHWTCSCDNGWLGNWLKRWYLETFTIRHPVSTSLASSATCQDPVTLRKKPIIDLTPNDNSCSVAALSAGSSSSFRLLRSQLSLPLILSLLFSLCT